MHISRAETGGFHNPMSLFFFDSALIRSNPTGLKWLKGGPASPFRGSSGQKRLLENSSLAASLKSSTEFTQAEWDRFVCAIRLD